MRKQLLDNFLRTAIDRGEQFVIVFGKSDGEQDDLEFMEYYSNEHQMRFSKNFWAGEGYGTRRVFDLNYLDLDT